MFTHSLSLLIRSTHTGVWESSEENSFLRKADFQTSYSKKFGIMRGLQSQHKKLRPWFLFFFHIPRFRKETLKKQEYSAGIRPEDACASLEKPSFACSLGSAFHTSIRRCMRICMTILHSSFHWRCDVCLSQEFPPFVKLFQTSRVGW